MRLTASPSFVPSIIDEEGVQRAKRMHDGEAGPVRGDLEENAGSVDAAGGGGSVECPVAALCQR